MVAQSAAPVCPGEREQDECGGVRRIGECGRERTRRNLVVWKRVVVKPEGDCELLAKERQVEIDAEQMVDERRLRIVTMSVREWRQPSSAVLRCARHQIP